MFYWLVKVVVTPLLRVLFRPRVEGLEHVPSEGGAILAGNHVSFSDSIFMPMFVSRKVTFLAKSDYFTQPGLKGLLKRLFFRGVGQVPLDRTGGPASQAALQTGVRLLREGQLLGIYPEGTRSPDGRLYRGRTGVAYMALEAGVPVVPVVCVGTDRVNPPGTLMWRIGRRPLIRFGAPLDFSRYAGMQQDRYVLRSMTDELMYGLMTMSGQEYVDTYASRRKAELAQGPQGPQGRGGEGGGSPARRAS